MKRIGALLVIVFQLLSNSGFSFNQGLEEKPDYLSYQEMALEELQYVFSASLVWEGLEDTPLPTTVVTSEEIKRYGWTNLRDILEYQPSFYLIRDLNERVIAHRGVSFRTSTFHLSFEEDEVKLNLPGYRNFVLDNSYPLLGVSKIEVVRGGLGSLYGEVGFTGAVSVYRRFFPKKGSLSAAMGTPSYQEFSLGTETPPDYPLRLKGVLHYSHEPGGKVEHDDSSFRVHPSPKNYSLQLSLKRNFFEAYLHHYYNRYDTPLSHSGKPLTSEDKEPFGSFEKVKFSVLGVKVSKPLGSWTIKLHPYLQVFSVDTPQVRKTHREGSFNAVDIELMSRGLNFEGVLLREFERGVLLFGFRHAMEDFEKTKIIELRNGNLKVEEIPSKGESFSSFLLSSSSKLILFLPSTQASDTISILK